MANVNAKIINEGKIVTATKLPVVTIGLGKVSKLKEVEGVIWHDSSGNTIIRTKEAPCGCFYKQDRTVVVRIIGSKVKMRGLYDIYAPAPGKIEKLLSNTIDLNSLSLVQRVQLAPILWAASKVQPSLAPAEPGRKVIVITKEMLHGNEFIECHCPWDPDYVMTKLYSGDIFLVEDEATCKGYRIGREEFNGTHVFS